MVLLIECLIGIILFSLIVIPSTIKDPVGWLGDYPAAIRERCIELGIIEGREQRLSKRELIKKILAVFILIGLLCFVLRKFNHADTFLKGFVNSYVIWLVIAWWDALVIDCGFFCHSKKVIIPGTEGMKEYKDYMFHIKQSLLGSIIGLPVCLLVGLIISLWR